MMQSNKILIVDDDKMIREILKDMLRDHYDVIEATCGDQALEIAIETRPDLILLDIEMPGINGIDVCRKLKQAEQSKYTPLILLSSHTRKDEIILGLQAGADDYLTKPIYLPEVLARVNAHLRSKGYYAELQHRDLQMLLELSDVISASRSPMKILRLVVQKMTEVLDGVRCSIIGIDIQGEPVVKASNTLKENTEIRLELSRYPEIHKAFKTRRAVVVNNVRKDPLMATAREFTAEFAYNSILVVPIIKKESVIGTFFLCTASPLEGGISRRVYNLCHLVANISANALENATLFESMKSAQKFLEERAIRDGLTNLYTHRHFYERLEEEFSRALRHQEPLSLILMDIDDFKRINDNYGHLRGDEVLRRIGRVVRKVVRESDTPARYGGEEFAVILPNTEIEGALEMANRLRNIIRNLRFEGLEESPVTVSIGVSTFSPNTFQSSDQLVRLADRAMYQAKSGGKDQVVAAPYLPLFDEPLMEG
jgi:two-component system cell cycle response regulator